MSFGNRVTAVCAAAILTLGLGVVPGQAMSRKVAAEPTADPRGADLADLDHNGLADGLDRTLGHADANASMEVVATFDGRVPMRSARAALPRAAVSTVFTLIDGFVANLNPARIRGLAARPGVLRVEPNFTVHALDDAANAAFGVTAAATDFSLTGAGTEICIPDTGVDLGHEQLDSKAPIAWKDFVNKVSTPYDDEGHGTFVASIAVGDGEGPGSIADLMRGVAPQASLSAAKVLDSTGYGDDALTVQAVQWCAARASATVISLSVGSDVASDGLDAISQAVNAAVANGKIVVAASGNTGDMPGTITSPGSAARAITVGAAAEWGTNPVAPYFSEGPYLAPFSSRGPTVDGRIKPDVIGPGVTIGAASAGSQSLYEVKDGTSFSTPYVAAVAALLKQAQSTWTPSNVRSAIEGTAVDAGPVGKDNDWGSGLIDAYAAIAQAEGATGHTPFPTHQRMTGTVANNGSSSKTFTLGTADLNAPIAATVTLSGSAICVLDLGPFGCAGWNWSPDLDAGLYGPNGFLITDSTCPAGDECTFGRQETLHFTPTVAGTYTIKIKPASGGTGAGGSYAIDVFHGPIAGGSTPPPPQQSSHIGDIDPSAIWVTSTRWRARATIVVHDQAHHTLAGTVVTGVWTGNTTATCTTNTSGVCFVQKRFASKKASVTFSVTNVSLAGYPYDPTQNHDPDGDSNGSAVTVVRPA